MTPPTPVVGPQHTAITMSPPTAVVAPLPTAIATSGRRLQLTFYRGLSLVYDDSLWLRKDAELPLSLSLKAAPDCMVGEQGPTEFPPVASIPLTLGENNFRVFEWDDPRLGRHVVWYALQDSPGGQRRPEGFPLLIGSVTRGRDWPDCRRYAEAVIASLSSSP